MKKTIKISIIAKLIAAVILFSPYSAISQTSSESVHPFSHSVNLGFESGLLLGMTDYINPNSGLGLNFQANYFFKTTNKFLPGIGISFAKNSLAESENNLLLEEYKASFFKLGLKGIVSFPIGEKIIPFAKAGVSYSFMDSKTNGITNSDNQNSVIFDLNTGLMIPVNERINFNLEAGVHFNRNDLIDNIEIGKYNDFYFSVLAGFSINFYLKKDTDKDQILDSEDQCPETAEDFDGFEDEDGCPDLDNDFDNIRDSFDECPNEAEDFDGFEDEDGCPDYDNDGDGIPDSLDQCMNEAEDYDGFEDEDGCPDYDNDGDGILDVDDNCPDEPETLNNFEDEDGCPDVAPETEEERIRDQNRNRPEAPAQFYIHGALTFLPDETNIRREAYGELNRIASVIKSYPGTRWRIEAHMDTAGDEDEIQRISDLRANSVLDYLLEQGISPSRLEAVGVGSQFPIADNATEYGRMRNRRIMIIRIR